MSGLTWMATVSAKRFHSVMSSGGRNGHMRIAIVIVAMLALWPIQSAAGQEQTPLPSSPAEQEEEFDELLLPLPKPWLGDFDGMRKRRVIRILVPYSRTFYFLDGAVQRGTVVDIGHGFVDWLNKKYKSKTLGTRVIFVPTSRDRLIPDLVKGLGDIAAGNLTITSNRLKTVDFAAPVLKGVKEVVVSGPAASPLSSVEELGGEEVYVRPSSSYHEHLVALNNRFKAAGKPEIKIKPADENLEDEDLMEMVNAGLLTIAIVDDHKADFWAQVLDNITVRKDLVIHDGGDISWAVRKNSPLLIAEINSFVKTHGVKSAFGAEIFRRYLRSTKFVKNATSKEEIAKFNQLLALFEKYGGRYNFDTLMLVAQGYQESRLDQKARSHMGAVGIMQVLPSTVEKPPISIAGVDKDAEKNIEAGAKYLRYLVETYINDPDIDAMNRTLMAFAAYNAGPGNLRKFRRIAAKSGLNPNVWFQNVELAAAKVVGRETVQYVSNIYKYYIAYTLVKERRAARSESIEKIKTSQ